MSLDSLFQRMRKNKAKEEQADAQITQPCASGLSEEDLSTSQIRVESRDLLIQLTCRWLHHTDDTYWCLVVQSQTRGPNTNALKRSLRTRITDDWKHLLISHSLTETILNNHAYVRFVLNLGHIVREYAPSDAKITYDTKVYAQFSPREIRNEITNTASEASRIENVDNIIVLPPESNSITEHDVQVVDNAFLELWSQVQGKFVLFINDDDGILSDFSERARLHHLLDNMNTRKARQTILRCLQVIQKPKEFIPFDSSLSVCLMPGFEDIPDLSQGGFENLITGFLDDDDGTIDAILYVADQNLLAATFAILIPKIIHRDERFDFIIQQLRSTGSSSLERAVRAVASRYRNATPSAYTLDMLITTMREAMPESQTLEAAIDRWYEATNFNLLTEELERKLAHYNVLFTARLYLEIKEKSRTPQPPGAGTPSVEKWIDNTVDKVLGTRGKYLKDYEPNIRKYVKDSLNIPLIDQQAAIVRELHWDAIKALVDLGFQKAEDLLDMKGTPSIYSATIMRGNLDARKPKGWPLKIDIEDGTAVKTDTLDELEDEIAGSQIVWLVGRPNTGKTTCALMYAYEWLTQSPENEALYFGSTWKNSFADEMQQRYTQLQPQEFIAKLERADSRQLLVIFDDAHLGLETLVDLVRKFEETSRSARLLIVSNTFLPERYPAVSNLWKATRRISPQMSSDDINKLCCVYHPNHLKKIGQTSIRASVSQVDVQLRERVTAWLRNLIKGQWSSLHRALDHIAETPDLYDRMVNGIIPDNQFSIRGYVYGDPFQDRKPEQVNLLLTVYSLSACSIPCAKTYLYSLPGGRALVEELVRNNLLEQSTTAFFVTPPQQAAQYLALAERKGRLGSITADDYAIDIIVKYLMSQPVNYVYVLNQLAATKEDRRKFKLIFRKTQPWYQQLVDRLIDQLHHESQIINYARAIYLLSLARSDLPQQIRQLETNIKIDDRIVENLSELTENLGNPDHIHQFLLALQYFRMTDPGWTRAFLQSGRILDPARIAEAMCSTDIPLPIITELFLEIHQIDLVFGQRILSELNQETLRKRVETDLSLVSVSKADQLEINNGKLRLLDIANVFFAMSLVDLQWTIDTVDKLNLDVFIERINRRTQPQILAQALDIFFRVSPGFVRKLTRRWQDDAHAFANLRSSFTQESLRFSSVMEALAKLSRSDRRLAQKIFNAPDDVNIWVSRWLETAGLGDLISGIIALKVHNRNGLEAFFEHLPSKELLSSVRAFLTAPNLARLVYTCGDVVPDIMSRLLFEDLSFEKEVLGVFNQGSNFNSGNVARFLIGLANTLEDSDSQKSFVTAWNTLKPRVEKSLLAPGVITKSQTIFFTLIHERFANDADYDWFCDDIRIFATKMVDSGGVVDNYITEDVSITDLSSLLQALGMWCDEQAFNSFIHRNRTALTNIVGMTESIQDLGNYLYTIGKYAPDLSLHVLGALKWSQLAGDIRHEYRLNYIAELMRGLAMLFRNPSLNHDPRSDTALDEIKGLTHYLQNRVTEEHLITPIQSLVRWLNEIDPLIASDVIDKLTVERIVRQCYLEPRMEVITEWVRTLKKVNSDVGNQVIVQLGEKYADNLNYKIRNVGNLGYLALALSQFHNPGYLREEYPGETDVQDKTTAYRIIDISDPNLVTHIRERMKSDRRSSESAMMLHYMSIVSPDRAHFIVAEENAQPIIESVLNRRSHRLTKGNLAMLKALNDNANTQSIAHRLARLLVDRAVTDEIRKQHEIRFRTAAIYELSRALPDDHRELYKRIVDETFLQSHLDTLISQYHARRIQIWEMGWCLWAFAHLNAQSTETRDIVQTFAEQLIQTITNLEVFHQLSSERNQSPFRRAFGLVGFGQALADSDEPNWKIVAETTIRDFRKPNLTLVAHIHAVAMSRGILFADDVRDKLANLVDTQGEERLEDEIWHMYENWFDIRDFPD